MDKQVIEIGGVKLEVDMRYAKRLDCLRVGDPVRVLVKGYGSEFKVHSGVVIGFEPFANLPTIIVAYMEIGYSTAEVKFLHLNANTKDTEVIAADSEARVAFDADEAVKALDRSILDTEKKLADLHDKKAYFITNIAQAWQAVAKATE